MEAQIKNNTIIIGAGIVGLASALKILEREPSAKITILEKEDDICKHQTGNNSGVIHSGIYYKPGSLKAVNCRKGYRQLLDFCDKHNVNYDICGKVIVAANKEELPYLDTIYQRGVQNGLENLRKITAEELKEIEPHVNGIAGILVPQTGIINFTEAARKYLDVILQHDAEIKFNQKVVDIVKGTSGIEVVTDKETYNAECVVSCAGLYSDKMAALTNNNLNLRIIPFRGEYYELKDDKKHLVNNLIYPVPDPAFPFLGVHFTRMIEGGVEAGPNAVLSFKREGYNKTSFNLKDTVETLTWGGFLQVAKKFWRVGAGEFYRSLNKAAFVKALQKLIPEIKEDDLVPGGAGVRAQACDKHGGLIDDFYILEDKNILHVCNAPSPAATSSLAIGEHIASKVVGHLK